MFFVINITRPPQSVTISDLGVTIGPHKAMDLEKMFNRSDIDASADVKEAIKTRQLQLRHNSVSHKSQSTVARRQGISAEELKSIKDAVKEQVREELLKIPSHSSTDVENKIDRLSNLVEQNLNKSSQVDAVSQQEDIDDSDNSKIAEIHAKVVSRKTQGAKTNISYQEKKTDDSLQSKVDELDDLIG